MLGRGRPRRAAVRPLAALLGAGAALPGLLLAGAPAAGAQPAAPARPAPVVRAAASPFVPSPANAYGDTSVVYGTCHVAVPVVTPVACVLGNPRAKRTVVLIGDSHAANWVPGLDLAGRRAGWRFVSLTKTNCSAAVVPVTLSADRVHPVPYRECTRWRSAVLRDLPRWRPSVVLIASANGARLIGADGHVYADTLAAQAVRTRVWQRGTAVMLAALRRVVPRATVLVLGDTPSARTGVVACVARAGARSATACVNARVNAIRDDLRAAERAALPANPRARVADLATVICPGEMCSPVTGRVLKYRDPGHLTATYARTLWWVWRAVLGLAVKPLPAAPVLWPLVPVPPPAPA
jgi:hypothetical protein